MSVIIQMISFQMICIDMIMASMAGVATQAVGLAGGRKPWAS
jgi:hypothetical protein